MGIVTMANKIDLDLVLDEEDCNFDLDVAPEIVIDDEYAPMVAKYSMPGDGELMKKALHIVFSSRQASTSYLQRRLGIGYNKAANLIEIMEDRGIVGPPAPGGSKRQILVLDEEFERDFSEEDLELDLDDEEWELDLEACLLGAKNESVQSNNNQKLTDLEKILNEATEPEPEKKVSSGSKRTILNTIGTIYALIVVILGPYSCIQEKRKASNNTKKPQQVIVSSTDHVESKESTLRYTPLYQWSNEDKNNYRQLYNELAAKEKNKKLQSLKNTPLKQWSYEDKSNYQQLYDEIEQAQRSKKMQALKITPLAQWSNEDKNNHQQLYIELEQEQQKNKLQTLKNTPLNQWSDEDKSNYKQLFEEEHRKQLENTCKDLEKVLKDYNAKKFEYSNEIKKYEKQIGQLNSLIQSYKKAIKSNNFPVEVKDGVEMTKEEIEEEYIACIKDLKVLQDKKNKFQKQYDIISTQITLDQKRLADTQKRLSDSDFRQKELKVVESIKNINATVNRNEDNANTAEAFSDIYNETFVKEDETAKVLKQEDEELLKGLYE